MDEDYEEPKRTKYSKVGRPRKYVGGWTSVSNLLVKQIKLHTDVYMRWMRLKGVRQHSEFANFLLDVYEQHLSTKMSFEEVVVESEMHQQPSLPLQRQPSRRKKNQPLIHIECYSDPNDSDEMYELSENLFEQKEDKPDLSPPPPHKRPRKSQFTIMKETKNASYVKSSSTNVLPSVSSSFLTTMPMEDTQPFNKLESTQESDSLNTSFSTNQSLPIFPKGSAAHNTNLMAWPSMPGVSTSVTDCSASVAEMTNINMPESSTGISSQGLKSSNELAVAKIISSLSDSFVNTASENSSKNTEKAVEQCLNCIKCQEAIHKKSRHMATQFTAQNVSSKSCRNVSTQTLKERVKNEHFNNTFDSRSVETQSWPSPLWTKYLIKHPEVIYNIDIGDTPEFPTKFRLYKRGDQLFSTLFGSKYQIQKRPSMRCISVSSFGGPEVLRLLLNIPTPKPTGRQVLINVKACGVNPVDTYIRTGNYSSAAPPTLPYTPGKDGAGIVQQVGDDVTKVKKGDRVWFFGCTTGSYAEYTICNENSIGQLPKNVSFEDGAMLGTPYCTAYRALFQRCEVKRGDTVMIHGATGGVGTAAIQLCQACGIRVVGTAGSELGLQLLNSLGVDKIYNHNSEGYIDEIKNQEGDIDVILEMLANVNLEQDLKIIGINGKILIIGSRGPTEINPRLIMANEANIMGVLVLKSSPNEKKEQFRHVNEGLQSGWLRPVLWKVLELEFAQDAHKEIVENSGARGQIVLKINPSSTAPEYVPMDV